MTVMPSESGFVWQSLVDVCGCVFCVLGFACARTLTGIFLHEYKRTRAPITEPLLSKGQACPLDGLGPRITDVVMALRLTCGVLSTFHMQTGDEELGRWGAGRCICGLGSTRHGNDGGRTLFHVVETQD